MVRVRGLVNSVTMLIVLVTTAACQSPLVAKASPAKESTPTKSPVSAPAWDPPALPAIWRGVVHCGPAYVMQANGRTLSAGSCSGELPRRLIKPVVVDQNTVFYVRVTHESNGVLDYPIPGSTGDAVVLQARRGSVLQYRATSPGSIYLVAHKTPFCERTNPRLGSCRIVQIVVK